MCCSPFIYGKIAERIGKRVFYADLFLVNSKVKFPRPDLGMGEEDFVLFFHLAEHINFMCSARFLIFELVNNCECIRLAIAGIKQDDGDRLFVYIK